MISGSHPTSKVTLLHLTALAAVLTTSLLSSRASAQFGFGFNRVGVVGGVSIDAEGAVSSATMAQRQDTLKQLRQQMADPAVGLADRTEMRMISLKKLQSEIAAAMAENRPLEDEVLYLAGLQRIEYVFVYPDRNDIVLAGPAEGWTIREDASIVGKTSGRPVLHLEDLLVALRTVEASRQAAISVSIEPTAEGQKRLERLLSQVSTGPGFNPAALEPAMKQAFGPQQVKLTTVGTNTRMAATLVAADYQMKRLAMDLEDPPVAGLPSYMEMIRNAGAMRGAQPRWWITCDYDAIEHSDDMLAWKLTGRGVKAMTENDFVDSQGNRVPTGKVNKTAQRWADTFTSKYDELSTRSAAFGDLRNTMDLNIVATVIRGHELQQLAGCDLGLLFGDKRGLETPQWRTPKTISPECSFVRGTSGWTVSASGGVEVNPWRVVAENSKVNAAVKSVHAKADSDGTNWWWN